MTRTAAPSTASSPPRAALRALYAPVADLLEESEGVLSRLIAEAAGPVAAPAAAIARGGKRIRPAVFLAAFRAAAGEGDGGAARRHAVRFAALVEAIHLSSLLHDDVLDEAAERRGVPTVNGLLGDKVAVLAAIFFTPRSFWSFSRTFRSSRSGSFRAGRGR